MNQVPNTKDFAFASGGIIWKILDRSRFEAKPIRKQIFFVFGLMILCWLPIAGLSLFKLGWNSFYLLFIRDIATHVRFLIVMPILLFTRRSFNNSFNKTIGFIHETKIVDVNNQHAFEKAMVSIEKWRSSKVVDFVIIVLVYSSFYFQETNRINMTHSYAPWHLVDEKITAAGWWYLVLSLPVLQILLYRWLYTILLWIIFLRKISRINLNLSALHPDGAGGLGFLQYTQLSFFPVALAFSALTAAVINNAIIFSGVSIVEYKIAIASILIFVLLLFVLPLLLLLPLLAKVKRRYFMLYSLESWPFARKYEEELHAFYLTEEEKPDASWHVDLIGSFEATRDMKIILIDKTVLLAFTAAVVLPLLPVVAQQVPLKEILVNLLGKIMG
jgi:hypothetical protein